MKTIYVTKTDIKNGTTTFDNCPVARALKRAYKTERVSVGWFAVINDRKFTLPDRVQKFITNFDLDDKVEPMKFQLKKAFDNP